MCEASRAICEQDHVLQARQFVYKTTYHMASCNPKHVLRGTGYHFWSDSSSLSTGINQLNQELPKKFSLSQNYPNPFNPSTKIKFTLPKPESVKIEVYNVIGQKVQTLLNKPMSAGYHELEFNGQNLSSGIYLYRIEAGEWKDVKKMILIR